MPRVLPVTPRSQVLPLYAWASDHPRRSNPKQRAALPMIPTKSFCHTFGMPSGIDCLQKCIEPQPPVDRVPSSAALQRLPDFDKFSPL